jgi:hypothetical protein
MCDYSLQRVKTRPAKFDKLVTREFTSTVTRGFASPENLDVAVCVLPGTELSFSDNVWHTRLWPWSAKVIEHKTAIFRQVNQDCAHVHHDPWNFLTARSCFLRI